MKSTEVVCDSILLSINSLYSLANIKEVLGIIILVVNALWLITKLIIKVVTVIKNKGNLSELDDEFEEVIDSIEDIVSSIDEEDTNNARNTEQK